MSRIVNRPGLTLLELLVTVTLLGLLSAMATLALPKPSTAATSPATKIAALRSEAAHARAPRTATLVVDSAAFDVTALPDGSLLGDTMLVLDRLAGVPRAP